MKKLQQQQQQQDLSDDLISEILSWLPVSSINRFKFASKSWLNLIISCIQNPSFVESHLNHSKKIQHEPTFLFYHHWTGILCPMQLNNNNNSTPRCLSVDGTLVYPSLNYNEADDKLEVLYINDPHEFDDDPPINDDDDDDDDKYLPPVFMNHPREYDGGLMLSDSCNGLIFLVVSGVYCLWNPCTQEFKRIPEPPSEWWKDVGRFNCTRSFRYGLAYDPVLDDYKVIIYAFISSPKHRDFFDCEVLVYTLGANSWRSIRYPYKLPADCPHIKKKPLYLNGAHHFIAYQSYLLFDFSILSFDLAQEEYREVPKPPSFDNMHKAELHLLRGCLCVCHIDNAVVNLWVMKDYGVEESWTKLFSTVQLDIVPGSFLCKPLWSWKNSDDILIEKDSKDVILYDPQRDKAKLLGSAGPCPGPPQDRWHDTQAYTGSFVSLRSGTYVHVINKDKDEKEEYKKRKLNKDSR